MTGLEVSHAGAFLAGLLSFLSPCVLPLVPPYLCFLGGVTAGQLRDQATVTPGARRRIFLASVAFVLGFSTVFVGLGAAASSFGRLIADYLDVLGYVAGAVIIVLGLHFIGLFRLALLDREVRFHGAGRPAGLAGAYLIGLAFAFGWTPCVGPVLAAILFVAGAEQSAAAGAWLLAAYAAGIGLPFLLAGAASGAFLSLLARGRRHLRHVEQVMGGLLVITGVLFLTGSMSTIAYWLLDAFPVLSTAG